MGGGFKYSNFGAGSQIFGPQSQFWGEFPQFCVPNPNFAFIFPIFRLPDPIFFVFFPTFGSQPGAPQCRRSSWSRCWSQGRARSSCPMWVWGEKMGFWAIWGVWGLLGKFWDLLGFFGIFLGIFGGIFWDILGPKSRSPGRVRRQCRRRVDTARYCSQPGAWPGRAQRGSAAHQLARVQARPSELLPGPALPSVPVRWPGRPQDSAAGKPRALRVECPPAAAEPRPLLPSPAHCSRAPPAAADPRPARCSRSPPAAPEPRPPSRHRDRNAVPGTEWRRCRGSPAP